MHLKSINGRPYPFRTALKLFWVNLFLTSVLVLFQNFLPPLTVPACMRPTSKAIFLSLGIMLLLNISIAIVLNKAELGITLPNIGFILVTGIIVFWSGSYRHPTHPTFLVTRLGQINKPVTPGEVILLHYGFNIGISVLADLPDITCYWTSLSHGAMDSPNQCDIVYSPPASEYDILTVRIGSSCVTQPIMSQIKLSIYP